MNLIKRFPVATLTTAGTVLLAGLTALLGTGTLTARQAAWASAAVAVLTAVLGAKVHGAVTPLVRPRDNAGHSLVPKDPA